MLILYYILTKDFQHLTYIKSFFRTWTLLESHNKILAIIVLLVIFLKIHSFIYLSITYKV